VARRRQAIAKQLQKLAAFSFADPMSLCCGATTTNFVQMAKIFGFVKLNEFQAGRCPL
jgi:hypothetical protein